MNQQERRYQFNQDWMERNFESFMYDGVADAKGKTVRVSNALTGLSFDEMDEINKAFWFGPRHLFDVVEVIAKKYLIETVVNEFWFNHLAAEEEAGHELEWAKP